MAVFNGEKYLQNAIESILNQDYKDFEFIIIDDCSKDKSIEIIKNYAENDERIIYFRNTKNLGLTKSLNKAIKLSKGDFIARQDVDDESLPNRLSRTINFLIGNPYFAFCGSNGYRKQNIFESLTSFTEFDDIKKNLIAQNCFLHSSIIIRRKILEKYGNYNKSYRYGQDYELWCRLIYKYKLKAKNLNEKLIVMNMPANKFYRLNIPKFIIQRINNIRTKLKFIRYTKYKFKCIFAIWIKFIEIIIFSNLTGYMIKIFKRFNF